MEANHTRIYGVSHCGPLSEQPVTSKPSRFLGYIPEESTPSPPPSSVAEHIYNQQIANENNQVSPLYVPPPVIHRPPEHLEFRIVDLNNRRTLEEHHHRNLEPDGESPNESQEVKYKRANVTLTDEEREEATTLTSTERIEGRNATTEHNQDEQMQGDQAPRVLIDPIAQERQLSKMASEIEMLRSQIEQLAEQNRMLINQQQKITNKSDLQTEETN